MKRIDRVSGWVAAVLLLAGSAAHGESRQAPRLHVVEIIGHAFVPADLAIQRGDEVLWINRSRSGHTVTADPRRAADPDLVRLPQGGLPFHSGTLRPGQEFREVFTAPGSYQYICNPHAGMGMVGRIHVADPSRRLRPRSRPRPF
jgi:plastocyanin